MRPALAAFVLLVLAACGSTAEPGIDAGAPDAGPPTWENVQSLFSQSCTFSSCHGSRAAGGLTLLPMVARSELLMASRQLPRMPRVTPGDASQSYLLVKLEGAMASHAECRVAGAPCGVTMPQSAPQTSAAVRAMVRAWIAAGAPGP